MPRTLAQNASYIKDTIKPAIKSAIEAQGVTVPSTDSFLDYADRIGEIEGGGSGYQLKDLPTGSISTVTDAAELPLNALKVSVEAWQDLHGYDHPWVGGAGKNKLPLVLADIKVRNTPGTWSGNNYTRNGVTFTIITDESENITGIKVTGTATANTAIDLSVANVANNTQVILNGCPSGGGDASYYIGIAQLGYHCIGSDVYYNNYSDLVIYCFVANGYAIPPGGVIFTPMVRLATETDPTFAPYSNICPISGWDEANLWIQASVDPTANPTATADFNTTVYVGSANLLTGEGTLIYLLISENDFEDYYSSESGGGLHWVDYPNENVKLNGNAKCNMLNQDNANAWNSTVPVLQLGTSSRRVRVYCSDESLADFKTTFNGLQICYELAEPIPFTFTPIPTTKMFQGTNNVYADCGEILEGEYFVGSSGAYDLYDYIQTDGTQSIDLGVKVNSGDVINCMYMPLTGMTNWDWLWLAEDTNTNKFSGVVFMSSTQMADYDYSVETNRRNWAADQINISNFTASNNINANIKFSDGAIVKLYSFSINGDDYLPCKRRSDGKFGLYDVKNSTFLTDSASGNAFVGGNNLGVRIG